jgi:hypothetical protein
MLDLRLEWILGPELGRGILRSGRRRDCEGRDQRDHRWRGADHVISTGVPTGIR